MIKKKKNIDYNKLYLQKRQAEIDSIKKTIINNKVHIVDNTLNKKYNSISSNSWFDIKKYTDDKVKNKKKYQIINKKLTKCKTILLEFSSQQKELLDKWFTSFILMYNQTINFFKKRKFNKESCITNWKKIRSNHLKTIRDKIQKESKIDNDNRTEIRAHMLDYAIKLASSNYKSALTNLRKGNIKHFRLRYWRHNKDNKIIDFEKGSIKNNNMCKIGNIKAFYNGKKFDLTVDSDCRLQYDSVLNIYQLFIPEKVNSNINNIKKNDFLGIDLGIRKFVSGVSNNEAIKIGTNVISILRKYIRRKNKINNNNKINKKIKKKNENLCRRKIKNLVSDLHWKVIKYITSNYNTIYIGDMSAKQIVNNKTSTLTGEIKEIALNLGIYKFRQRLEFKCEQENVKYKLINERFTTKMCCKCGWVNEEIGKKEIFNCKECGMKEDRDINSASIISIKNRI